MIVLKFISSLELDVIVNGNEWSPFIQTHSERDWKQMHFLLPLLEISTSAGRSFRPAALLGIDKGNSMEIK